MSLGFQGNSSRLSFTTVHLYVNRADVFRMGNKPWGKKAPWGEFGEKYMFQCLIFVYIMFEKNIHKGCI